MCQQQSFSPGFPWVSGRLNYFMKVFITNEKQTPGSESICVFEVRRHLLHTFEDPPFLLPWPLCCFPWLHRIPVNSQSNTPLSLDSVLTHGVCLLSHEGKFIFPKEFQTLQSRHSDASRWLDPIFTKRSAILATVQLTIPFSGLPFHHWCT